MKMGEKLLMTNRNIVPLCTMYIVGALNHNGDKINDTDERIRMEQR